MKLEGVFLYYDKENGNGRIYTKECAQDMIKQARKLTDNGNCLGEITPPQDGRDEVLLSSVSHRVNEVWLDEAKEAVMGRLEILEGTPKGIMIEKLISECGVENFSVASRGVGTVNPETKEIEDYKLITFDIVEMEKSSTKGPIQISDL